MRQVKNKRPDRIASRRRVRTRQAAGIGSRLELRVWVFAIAVLSAMVYVGAMRDAKVFSAIPLTATNKPDRRLLTQEAEQIAGQRRAAGERA